MTTTRRQFIGNAMRSAAGAALVGKSAAPVFPAGAPPRGFVDLLRPPDVVGVQSDSAELRLVDAGGGRWSKDDVVVTTAVLSGALSVSLATSKTTIKRIHMRWRGRLPDMPLILGDAWERGYGDLEWRGWAPDRVMPWYAATSDRSGTHAYGVRTSARAFCFWQIDPQGVSLWADVRSGAAGLKLGERVLDVCDVVCRAGREGESSFAALRAFCATMCAKPRLPASPIYGSNDWYWAYGKNSADTVLADAQHVVELSPTGRNRPFVVIDDGWQPVRGQSRTGVGTWDRGNEKFPDMSGLAQAVGRAGARPGIWIRPLQAPADAPDAWRLARDRAFLDPTVPEARQKVVDDIARLKQWGFELIKHDYTTYDVFGRWGFQMGAALTRDGWTFASGPTRTTAEVIDDLYRAIRDAAVDSLIIGCNTVKSFVRGPFRGLPSRRRYERHRMGAHAEDGSEHPGVPRPTAWHLLWSRCRLRRRDERHSMVLQSAVARSCLEKRYDVVRLTCARRSGRGTASRSQGGARARSGTAASRGTARLATQRVSVPLATDGSRANVRLGRRRRRRSALNGALTTRALRSG